MKIEIDYQNENDEVNVLDWDDPDALSIELHFNEYVNSETFTFKRPKKEAQFYSEGEVERFGEQLLLSEKRALKLFELIESSASKQLKRAREIINSQTL